MDASYENSLNNVYTISKADKNDHQELIKLWEVSVRMSHDFIIEEDILAYKSLIAKCLLEEIKIDIIKDSTKKIIGFIGINDDKIEMLFVIPEMQGKGVGKTLVNHALRNNITKIGVNEQNKKAFEFYLKMGFVVESRSELDMTGRPYPIAFLRHKPDAPERPLAIST